MIQPVITNTLLLVNLNAIINRNREDEKNICRKCGSGMFEYEVNPKFLEGEFYYCGEYPEDHPWIWVKPNGEVIEKK